MHPTTSWFQLESRVEQTEAPLFYDIHKYLCVDSRPRTCTQPNTAPYISCRIGSVHSKSLQYCNLTVDSAGLHLESVKYRRSALLLPWSCIIAWRTGHCRHSVIVYLVGLRHPCTEIDQELEKSRGREHSLEENGLAHDASLATCCLVVLFEDQDTLLSSLELVEIYAWCGTRNSGQKPLLLMVNHTSGKGESRILLKSYVEPLLTFVKIPFEVFITEYEGHAKELVSNMTPEEIDRYEAVLIVSGDGLLHEFINGLHSSRGALPLPAIGIIPTGSGNAVASAICYRSGISCKTDFVRSCVLTFALPKSPFQREATGSFTIAKETSQYTPLLVEADTFGEAKLSTIAATWGIIAELDLRSNFLRRIGSIRFTLMFLYLLVRLKTHRCTVSFLPAEGSEEHLKRFREAFPNSSGHTFPRNSATTNGALKTNGDHQHSNEYSNQRNLRKMRYLPNISDTVPDSWITVTSKFIGINVVNSSHLASDGVYFAKRGLDSDYINLHLLPASMPRIDLLGWLNSSFGGHGLECHQYGILIPTKAFRLSIDSETAKLPYIWTIDGETAEGVSILQGEKSQFSFPLIVLPTVERDNLTHAPLFS